jgi:hypothetical protein
MQLAAKRIRNVDAECFGKMTLAWRCDLGNVLPIHGSSARILYPAMQTKSNCGDVNISGEVPEI